MNLRSAILLLAVLVISSAFRPFDDAEDKEWNAAAASKQKKDWKAGAAAFEQFARQHAPTPRAAEALVEAGVCWIGLANEQQRLHRNTPESSATYKTAGKLFERVLAEQPESPLAPRAQYLTGQVALYLGDPAAALKAYDLGVQKSKSDAKYRAKCLERRAASRRLLLDNAGALRDLATYLQSFPKGGELEQVQKAMRYTQGLDREAPAWLAERWALSDPLAPEAYHGDVVVLCFLGSWCEKCAAEKDFLKDLKQRFESLGVRFVGVVQPWQDHDGKTRHTLESFTAFAAGSGYGFPLLQDSGNGPGGTAAAFGCEKLPDMVIVDRSGRVRWHDHPANLLDVTLEKLAYESNENARESEQPR